MSSPQPASIDPGARRTSAWRWIPSLYFAEGLPFVVVMSVSVILYKRLGVSNTEIALYTSLLYLPWVIKPLWSPTVDVIRTKRWWIVSTQLLIGAGLAGVALALPTDNFFRWTLAFFWILAVSSATHDIAADGFYMLALSTHEQAWFVGIRSTFYRIAMIAGQGLLVMIAGLLETGTGFPDVPIAIDAVAEPTAEATFEPRQWSAPHTEGAIRITSDRAELSVGVAPREATQVERLIERVRAWNTENGFYEVEEKLEVEDSTKPGWLVAFEEWIVRYFGPDERQAAPTGMAGDVAVVLFAVTGPVPSGESVDVVFERASGDANFQVVEGSRFSVTDANWNAPFAAVIQLDHRVDRPTSAVFRARSGNFVAAWTSTFYLAAGIFLGLCLYHAYALPRPASDRRAAVASSWLGDFGTAFATFFQKKDILAAIAFLLLYRFAEAQLVKLASPFLLELREGGGLAMSTGEVGFVYGTVGVVALVAGGILGGWVAARHGLRFWLPWMALAINLPNLAYVFLSQVQPESFLMINAAIAVEQFGYGFGFAAYMLYMLYVARGQYETSHYAICTGFMALSMMLPGMFSGWLQELVGYKHFFIWVMISTIPSFLVTAIVFFRIDPAFGRRENAN